MGGPGFQSGRKRRKISDRTDREPGLPRVHRVFRAGKAVPFKIDLESSMVRKRTIELHCPTCKAVVTDQDPEFHFCRERCRMIDLGKWASGAYVIHSLVQDISDDPDDRTANDVSEE
jgi:endogenous inhibitor of DNA gyrase (YacG/DUF329 family)